MIPRYIDANEIIYMHDCFPLCTGDCKTCERRIVRKDFIDAMDTVDVQEVKHGKWISGDFGEYLKLKCSVCASPNEYRTDYCPNCGARMDGEEDAGT